MASILDHFSRNKLKYGVLLGGIGTTFLAWGGTYDRVGQLLIVVGAVLTGSALPSDRESKTKQVDAAKFEENVRKYQE